MGKKIINIVLYTGLIAVLVVGAINRTQAKSSNTTSHSSSEVFTSSENNSHNFSGSNSQGGVESGKGRRNQSSKEYTPKNYGTAEFQNQGTHPFTIETLVDSVSRETLVLSSLDGATYEIEGRACSYAQDQGFFTGKGNQILLTVYYDADNTFKAAGLVNADTGDSVIFRDEIGQPMWAGFRNK
jgi:hypothetical protein